MKTLIALSIQRPIFAWMILAALILFGYLNFRELGISERPDVDFPTVSVSFEWEGAAPEVIEMDVLSPMEGALLAVADLQNISSEAKRGEGQITLDFAASKNIDQAVQEIQTILGRAQRQLPTGVSAPSIRKRNPEDRPILWLSLSSDKLTGLELSDLVQNVIKDRFLTIAGVSDIQVGGLNEPEVQVNISGEKLRKWDLTISDVITTIEREHGEYPAGSWKDEKTESTLRVKGEAATIEEMQKLSINTRGGGTNYSPIALNEVASVKLDQASETRMARANGINSLGLGILKQRGTNAVEVARAAKIKMEEIKALLPEGVKFDVRFDGTTFIEESVQELIFNLFLSVTLTALVVWFFLGSWGASLNIILSIPTAIMGAFIVINAFDFTLNSFTLLALTLAVGLVVDDNILVLENIQRLFKEGKDKITASYLGTIEVSAAALAASLAIIAIFLPIGFVSGMLGPYLSQFAITLSATVAFSYLDAITLTPMRTSLSLGRDPKLGRRWIDRAMSVLEKAYFNSLQRCLRFRWPVLILALLSLALTWKIGTLLPREMTPAQDQGRLMLQMRTPPGSSLHFTNQKVREVEKILASHPEIESTFITIGGWGAGESNQAFGFLSLVPKNQRNLSQTQLVDLLQVEMKKVNGLRSFIRDPSQSGLGGQGQYPIEFHLQGKELSELNATSEKIKTEWENSGLMVQVDSSYKGDLPEIHIVPDRDKARARGVSIETIGTSIQALIQGSLAGKFSSGGTRYDIRVKLAENELKNLDDLKNLFLRNNRGELVSLASVAKVLEANGPQSIKRSGRNRVVTITANLAPGKNQGEALAYIQKTTVPQLPSGLSLMATGNTLNFQEGFKDFTYVLGLGILVAFMVLAAQYNSLLWPMTILTSLPFSFLGAFLFLWAFGQGLNMYSMIGLILLMGIVKKNAIILVDFTNQRRMEGLNPQQALLSACPTRLRPIVMTSLTTMASALPAIFAIGPGSETRLPLGLTVMGGLIISTVLTLYIVPCLYSIIPGRIDRQREDLINSALKHEIQT